MVGRALDLTGQVFGRLTIIGIDRKEKKEKGTIVFWKWHCSCGNIGSTRTGGFRTCGTVSCGCKKVEQLSKHGMVYSDIYGLWQAMINRCHSPSNAAYKNYGGRGILVCERWRISITDFADDIGPRPSRSYTLDRYPNNNGNYEPGNVRWATKKQQGRNSRSNSINETIAAEIRSLKGKMTQTEMSRKFNCSFAVISNVIHNRCWVPE